MNDTTKLLFNLLILLALLVALPSKAEDLKTHKMDVENWREIKLQLQKILKVAAKTKIKKTVKRSYRIFDPLALSLPRELYKSKSKVDFPIE